MRPRSGSIDRILAAAYLALTACGGAPGPVVPTGAAPSTPAAAQAWIDGSAADGHLLHRFRWLFRDREGSAGGRGTARITPGDSLRFDVVGPLGTGRGAAFVVGDSALWAEPEEDVAKLVPNYPLLWAMLGVARLPVPVAEVSWYQDEKLTAWRFIQGSDTTEYARFNGPPVRLVADVRQAGRRLGRVETVFTPEGRLKSSRLDVPTAPARLDISYNSTAASDPFPLNVWQRPAPDPPR